MSEIAMRVWDGKMQLRERRMRERDCEWMNEWENGKWGEIERENMKGVWENKER